MLEPWPKSWTLDTRQAEFKDSCCLWPVLTPPSVHCGRNGDQTRQCLSSLQLFTFGGSGSLRAYISVLWASALIAHLPQVWHVMIRCFSDHHFHKNCIVKLLRELKILRKKMHWKVNILHVSWFVWFNYSKNTSNSLLIAMYQLHSIGITYYYYSFYYSFYYCYYYYYTAFIYMIYMK